MAEAQVGKPAQVSETDVAAYKRQRQVMENAGQLVGQVQWGPSMVGEGMRGLVSQTGKHFSAAPEGHLFTDVGKERLQDMVQYRVEGDLGHFRIPYHPSTSQVSDVVERARGLGRIIVDRFHKVNVDPWAFDSSDIVGTQAALRKLIQPWVAP